MDIDRKAMLVRITGKVQGVSFRVWRRVEADRDMSTASAMTASCMAKLAPMQMRGPAPKGRYW